MKTHTMIEETLRDFEEGKKKLSLILTRALRIATILKDFEGIYWFTINLNDLSALTNIELFREEILKGLLKQFSKEEAKKIFNRTIEDYLVIRHIDTIKDAKGNVYRKEGSLESSVANIENSIDSLQANIKLNTLPDGLHSLDLYFMQNSKRDLDILLQNLINIHVNILERIKAKSYEILIKYENKEYESSDGKAKIENNRYVFIIHGHNEAKWRELKTILENDFNLCPIILQEKPDRGMTIIEKFEYYAEQCCYAFAIFTPDDIIDSNGNKYFQSRPNVIFEVGWFCSHLGRDRVCIIVQDDSKMQIFSDFQGILQKRFYKDIGEILRSIKLDLQDAGII